jgi:hypothetical protein
MANASAQFTQLLAATLDEEGTKATDQIFEKVPTYEWLRQKGRVSKISDWKGSGKYFHPKVTYAKSTASGYTSGYKTLNVIPQTFIGDAVYEMKLAYASCTYDIEGDVLTNRSPNQLINIVTEKKEQAKETIIDNLNTALFATSVATDYPNTLVTMVDSTGTIGGINQSTYSWWASYEAAVGSWASGGIEALDIAYNTVSKGKRSGMPGIIITDQTTWQYFANSVRAFAGGGDNILHEGDLGVPAIKHNGVEVIWDPDCASGTMFLLNARSLGLVTDDEADLKSTEFVKPADQLAYVGQIYFRHQLITTERRAQGKLTGITA